jgi:hypothetical protein
MSQKRGIIIRSAAEHGNSKPGYCRCNGETINKILAIIHTCCAMPNKMRIK